MSSNQPTYTFKPLLHCRQHTSYMLLVPNHLRIRNTFLSHSTQHALWVCSVVGGGLGSLFGSCPWTVDHHALCYLQRDGHLFILKQPIPGTATEPSRADRSLTSPGADDNQKMGDSQWAVAGSGSTDWRPATAPMMIHSRTREEASRRNISSPSPKHSVKLAT